MTPRDEALMKYWKICQNTNKTRVYGSHIIKKKKRQEVKPWSF